MIGFSRAAIVTLECIGVTEPKRHLPRMLWTFEVMGKDLYGCLVIAQPKGIPLSAGSRSRIALLVARAGLRDNLRAARSLAEGAPSGELLRPPCRARCAARPTAPTE